MAHLLIIYRVKFMVLWVQGVNMVWTKDNIPQYKTVNNVEVLLTEEEKQYFVDLYNSAPSQFDNAMSNLRNTRNSLLAQTDYLALSDQTMSAEMTAYRQALRDITNGLTTVADVEAVVFPEKPGA